MPVTAGPLRQLSREDPKVTGVLPVALNEATKIIQAFLHSGKEYVCRMQLHEAVPSGRVEDILRQLAGPIYQRPPLRASVKREVRIRTIYSMEILEVDERRILFKVACQAGTYVRKLVYDAGEILGVGAHMTELRRIRAGAFTEQEHLYNLHQLLDANESLKEGEENQLRRMVRPMEEAFKYIPKIYIRDSAVDSICHGASLAIPGVVKLDSAIRTKTPVVIFTLKGEVVALANALASTEQILNTEKGLAAKTVRVIMQTGTYPALWRKQKNIEQ